MMDATLTLVIITIALRSYLIFKRLSMQQFVAAIVSTRVMKPLGSLWAAFLGYFSVFGVRCHDNWCGFN